MSNDRRESFYLVSSYLSAPRAPLELMGSYKTEGHLFLLPSPTVSSLRQTNPNLGSCQHELGHSDHKEVGLQRFVFLGRIQVNIP